MVALAVVFYAVCFLALAAVPRFLLFLLHRRGLHFLLRLWNLGPVRAVQTFAVGVAAQVTEKTLAVAFYAVSFLAFAGDIFVGIFRPVWGYFFCCFSFGSILVLLYNILRFEISVFYIFPPHSPPLFVGLVRTTIVLFIFFIGRVLPRWRGHLKWQVSTLTFLVKIVIALPTLLWLVLPILFPRLLAVVG